MSEAITIAFITGGVSLVGTIITVLATSRRTDQAMQISQAVTDTKLEELTREVREHNNYAKRLPVVEEQIKNITQRVENLEERL